jgi:hypothetical protein
VKLHLSTQAALPYKHFSKGRARCRVGRASSGTVVHNKTRVLVKSPIYPSNRSHPIPALITRNEDRNPSPFPVVRRRRILASSSRGGILGV